MFARLGQWLRRLFAPRPAVVRVPSGPPLTPLLQDKEFLWVQAEAAMVDRVVAEFFDIAPPSTEHLDRGMWLLLASARPRGYRIPDPAFVRVLAMETTMRTLALVLPLPADRPYTLRWRPRTGALPEIVRDDGGMPS